MGYKNMGVKTPISLSLNANTSDPYQWDGQIPDQPASSMGLMFVSPEFREGIP